MRYVAAALAVALASIAPHAASAQTAPWTWPAVPDCLRETPAATAANPRPTPYPQLLPSSPPAPALPAGTMSVCDARTMLTTRAEFSVLSVETAREVNDRLPDDAFEAFEPGTMVVRFVVRGSVASLLRGPNALARFSSSRQGAVHGNWWTLLGDVSDDGKTVRAAPSDANALALASYPRCVAFGNDIAAGVQGYFGMVSKGFGEQGGAVEFWFPAPDSVVASPANVLQVPGGERCV